MDNARIELKTVRRVLIEENKCAEKEEARTMTKVVCPEPRVMDSICNSKTGFAIVSKEQPVIEKCICKTRMQQFKIPCSKFRFIFHSAFTHVKGKWKGRKIITAKKLAESLSLYVLFSMILYPRIYVGRHGRLSAVFRQSSRELNEDS